jgi:hypothetical protein
MKVIEKYWYAVLAVGVVVAVAAGVQAVHPFYLSTGTAEAASADTITFSLNASNDNGSIGTATVTATNSSQTVTGTEVNFKGVKYISPSLSNLGKGTFKTDFRIGVQVCEYPGTNCGMGWTYWASDIAKQGFDLYSAPVVLVSSDPSHDRFNYVTISLQTRPLPAGTQFQAEIGDRLVEYDYVFPNTPWMEGANISAPLDPYCGGTFTPAGGGTGSAVGAEERLGTCRGQVISSDPDVIELTINAFSLETFNASHVSDNIPSTFNVGETKTTGSDGNQLEITMKNTGTALWPMKKGNATGTQSGICQTDADGSGLNDAPSATAANNQKSCTTDFIYATPTDLLTHSGSFSVNLQSAQAIKVVPVTITYTAPVRVCYTEPGDCPTNGNSTLLNDKSPFFPTAYAMAACLGGTGPQRICEMDDGGYSYSYGAGTSIAPGDEATFILKSMTAPSSNGKYTETWQMQDNGDSFGSTFTPSITVGNGSNTGTINVTSEMAGSGTPVPATWVVFPGYQQTAPATSATYTNVPEGITYALGGETTTVPGLVLKDVRAVGFAEAHENILTGLFAMLKEPFGPTAHADTIYAALDQQVVADPSGEISSILLPADKSHTLNFQIDWTTPQTLSLGVQPSATGPVPFTVTITATINGGGSASLPAKSNIAGVIKSAHAATAGNNYLIWQNCNYAGTDPNAAKSLCGSPTIEADNVTASSYTAPTTYSTPGTFNLFAIAETASGNIEASATITATSGTGGSHLECQNSTCTSVPGGGTNQCAAAGDSCSGGASHLACVSNSCSIVSGSGTDGCSSAGSVCSEGQQLSATLSAYPSSGNAPLATMLTASAANGAGGTYNYTFWQDCSYSGTSVSDATTACGTPTKKDDSLSATTDTAGVTYPDVKTYHPLVIVENGGSAVQAVASVTTSGGGGSSHLACQNDTCTKVSGSGSNQCVAEGDACVGGSSHLACQNDACVAVSGSGSDQCATNSDCAPPPPSCTFSTKSTTPIVPPESATLSWTCSNANSCSIDQGVGTVNPPSGSVKVYPTSTTVYTLNCNGSTWTTSVLVNNPGQIEVNP